MIRREQPHPKFPQPVPVEDAVLEDPRWEALAAGHATPEEVTELREWAKRSKTASAAWQALQPLTNDQIDRFAIQALRNRARSNDHEILGGKYRLLKKIGEGAFESIWEGENIVSGRRVEIKRGASNDESITRVLQREIDVLRRVSHPHVWELLDSGRAVGGQLYLVLERLEGHDLRQRLKAKGRLEIAQALRITRAVASALDAMHRAGFVHRNVGSSNVFLHQRGENDFNVKLLGFGVSKSMRAPMDADDPMNYGVTLGTMNYLSPELERGAKYADERTDIWSLGLMLYEMLTGARALRMSSVSQQVFDIKQKSVSAPSDFRTGVTPSLDEFVRRCTTRAPELRYRNMGEVLSELTIIEEEYRERPVFVGTTLQDPSLPRVVEAFEREEGTSKALIRSAHPYRSTKAHLHVPATLNEVEALQKDADEIGRKARTKGRKEPRRRSGTKSTSVVILVIGALFLCGLVLESFQSREVALSMILLAMAVMVIHFYHRSRAMEKALEDKPLTTTDQIPKLQEKILALEAEKQKLLEWLETSEHRRRLVETDLETRCKIERRVYRIVTFGVKGAGKTSLVLKWANPLVELGDIESTRLERYERVVSSVNDKSSLVNHVFELYDWGGEHIVESQEQLLTGEIDGILMVVDLGGPGATEVDPARIEGQLSEFNPHALRYFITPTILMSCKTIVLFINKSDLISGAPEEAERQAKKLYRPLIETLEQYAEKIDVRIIVGSAQFGHSTHTLFSHFVQRILPASVPDYQLSQRTKNK